MATQVRIDWPEVECVRCDASAPVKSASFSLRPSVAGTVDSSGFTPPDGWTGFTVLPRRGSHRIFYICPACVNGE